MLDIANLTDTYESPDNTLTEAVSGTANKQTYRTAYADYTGNLPLLVVPI